MTCPEWCAGGHRCTAGAGGEHRSDPQVWVTSYGSLVVTRVQRAAARDWVEIRATVALQPDTALARDEAARLVLGVHFTVLDVLAGRLRRIRDAYRRLTGAGVR